MAQAPAAVREAPSRAARRPSLRAGGPSSLVPLRDLEPVPGGAPWAWRACGPRPLFLIPGPFPPGWFRIRLKMTSATPGWLELCASDGEETCLRRVEAHGTVDLDTSLLHYSEITCKASFHHTPEYIRKALDLVCAGQVTASFFVNNEEPLANLLEVMRHLMSHNGHLKTAILP